MAAAVALGLVSVPHCAGMCGPLAAFACGGRARAAPARYLAGRSVSYAGLGALAGWLGERITDALPGPWVGAAISWTLAAALGAAAYRLWRRPAPKPALVELRPSRQRTAILQRFPTLVGLVTGMLPCGALLGAVIVAAGAGSVAGGALTMVAFSLVTAVGPLGAGLLASRAARDGTDRWLPRTLAVALALGAVVMILRPIDGLRDRPAECHEGPVEVI